MTSTSAQASYFPMRPAGDLYNWALGAVERRNWRVYDPSSALANDPNVYQRMLADPEIRLALRSRCTKIAGREWECVPASTRPDDVRLARVMSDLVNLIRNMDQARLRLAMACFYGAAVEEMRGDFKRVHLPGDSKPRRWFVIDELKNVDKRRFARWRGFRGRGAEGDAPGSDEREWVMWGLDSGEWTRMANPERFIKHVYEEREDNLGYGSGLADSLFFAFYAKGIALSQGLAGLERWAQGWITAKVDDAREGSTAKDNATVVRTWISKLEEMRSKHVLVYGKNDEVDVVEPTGTGHQIVMEFLAYLDSQIVRLITGSMRPTGGGGASATGARAQAGTEADESESIVQFEQGTLDGTFSSDVVTLLVDMNAPILREMGLGNATPPKFRSVKQKTEDPEKNAIVASTLLGAGVELLAEEVYAKTGYSVPKAGERTIKQRAPAPMPGGPFGAFEAGSE